MPLSSPLQAVKVESNNFEHHLILLRHVEQNLFSIKHYYMPTQKLGHTLRN